MQRARRGPGIVIIGSKVDDGKSMPAASRVFDGASFARPDCEMTKFAIEETFYLHPVKPAMVDRCPLAGICVRLTHGPKMCRTRPVMDHVLVGERQELPRFLS